MKHDKFALGAQMRWIIAIIATLAAFSFPINTRSQGETVLTVNSDVDLRTALTAIDGGTPGVYRMVFGRDVTVQTDFIAGPRNTSGKAVFIQGNGFQIDFNFKGSFWFTEGPIEVENLTIRNGDGSYVDERNRRQTTKASFQVEAGETRLTNVTIDGSYNQNTSRIYPAVKGDRVVFSSGSITGHVNGIQANAVVVSGGRIYGNSMSGIQATEVFFNDGEIHGNARGISGTSVTITGGIIRDNAPGVDQLPNTPEIGAGVYTENLTMTGGRITANSSGAGAGIWVQGGTVDISGGRIDSNVSSGSGAGILGRDLTSVNIQNLQLFGNIANQSSAMLLQGPNSAPLSVVLRNNSIAANTGAGTVRIDALGGGTIDAQNNLFENNPTTTPALWVNGANSGTITQNGFVNNGIGLNANAGVFSSNNWWGDTSGPAPFGNGDEVLGGTVATPISTSPCNLCPNPTGPAKPDYYAVSIGGVLNVPAEAGVLANDDPSTGASLVYGPFPASAGTLNLNPDGSFRFASNGSYIGPVRFKYQVGGQDANVEITVGDEVRLQYPESRLSASPGERQAIRGIRLFGDGDPVVSITLSVTGGILSVDEGRGEATITGNNTRVLSMTGRLRELNKLLDPLYYTADGGTTADSLVISSGTGFGFTKSPPLPIDIQVNAPPTANTNINIPITIPNVAVIAPQGDNPLVTVEMSVNNGILNVDDTVVYRPGHVRPIMGRPQRPSLQPTDTVIVIGNGTGAITITGPVDGVNQELGTLIYTPNTGYQGTDIFVIIVRDSAQVERDRDRTIITVGNFNVDTDSDPPVVSVDPIGVRSSIPVPNSNGAMFIMPDGVQTLAALSAPGVTNSPIRAGEQSNPAVNQQIYVTLITVYGEAVGDPSAIGDANLLNQRIDQAVDLYSLGGWYGGNTIHICMKGSGTFYYRNTRSPIPGQPRETEQVPVTSYDYPGYSCAQLPNTGVLVLVAGAAPTPVATAPGYRELTDCMLYLNNALNVRSAPNLNSTVLDTAKFGHTLTAERYQDGWYYVDNLGVWGWISAGNGERAFVTPQGGC